MTLAADIKQRARELGFDLVGITGAEPPPHATQFREWLAKGFQGGMDYLARNADKRSVPTKVLRDARSIIVVAMNYNSVAGAHANGNANISQYAWGKRDYHNVLGEKLDQLATFIVELGGKAKWCIDTAPLLERDLAQRAGIGFVGKHTNLISRSLGNWLFLGEVLTNLELPVDPPERSHCGNCYRCLDACPTGALVAPYRLDARRCISYLTIELKGAIPVELRSVIGDRVFGCDDCLAVCPWNRFAKMSPAKEFRRRTLPPLTEFLSWDEQKFCDFFREAPILRVKRGGFLRNVCVVLGNTGNQSALPLLERARHDPEPLINEHAAWAIAQIRERRKGQPPC